MTDLQPGKLYRVTARRVLAVEEAGLCALPSWYSSSQRLRWPPILLQRNDIFLFVETIKKDFSQFSKILVDDKIVITYNGYLLRNRVIEAEPKSDESIPGTRS